MSSPKPSPPRTSELRGPGARVLLALYSVLLTAGVAVSAPWWLLQMARTGKYREGLSERLGFVPGRIARPGPGAEVVWLHAVSVGEVLAVSRLVVELRAAGRVVFLSTTTRTGQAVARERFGAEWVFYYPLDFAFAVRAWLTWLRPKVFVLAESEFWPRMLAECARSGVPVVVVNARVSDRSWPRYLRLARLWRPLLATVSWTVAQSERDAERLRALGVARVQAGGNLKYEVRAPEAAGGAAITAELGRWLPEAARLVVCGSTLEGEEKLLLDAVPADAMIVLAPRHPERFRAVAELLARSGRPFVQRSTWTPGPIAPGASVLLDSIGELASVYGLATVACVGGSWLLPGGGHNPLEPALLGVPVVTGPYTANFASVVDAMLGAEAIVVADGERVRAALANLLADPERARALGARGRLLAESQAGATARCVQAIEAALAANA